MTSYSYDKKYTNDSVMMDPSAKKVYINPNFQKFKRPAIQNGLMYINPLFPQLHNLHPTNTPKIYVNPNFVNTHSTEIDNQYKEDLTRNYENISETINQPVNTGIHNILITAPIVLQGTDSFTTDQSKAITKSRYRFVRQPYNKILSIEKQTAVETKQIATTFQINKYKSISIEQAKKELEKKSVENAFLQSMSLQSSHIEKNSKHVPPEILQSRFKFIKNQVVVVPNNISSNIQVNKKQSTSKVLLRTNQKVKIKINRKKFNKNNIPCPLFKKYGKCLRNVQGKCELLHDKKHVTVCRNFLRGVCHEGDCPLSHEVTAKKMPTCYFYLKGMCTKEDCPYLHIKLNEKAKICTDFLKGYCEKGNKCLYRHCNICPDFATKGTCLKKRCRYPHKSNKKLVINKAKNKIDQSNQCKKNIAKPKPNAESSSSQEDGKNIDCRYYKVIENGVEGTETIKPTRCKLGALPSFIQL